MDNDHQNADRPHKLHDFGQSAQIIFVLHRAGLIRLQKQNYCISLYSEQSASEKRTIRNHTKFA